ncbi:alpha/beta fold hydrolase [Pedobacter punctiformis]|uniref:Alpha/beta hydrolase n=1 Tax=Pedobacter punctiformis TaxID=3004097 RepID=A0ABT4LCW6_9SPHI|nr:alpha/beta hydrolase [Pedobacter sp. HCMS5-2]MCZ4245755.1 alpha/beta hydrolase [Pedobacter sp. HCMS5-2]
MKVYLISGLGADKRIFSKIKLDNQFEIIHLDWIEYSESDDMISYAKKLSKGIDHTKPFCIVGVSFGGMIATEIAKILNPKITIVISSIINSKQLPRLYKFSGNLGLLNIIPAAVLKSSNKLTQNYYFGTKLPEEKDLLNKIVEDTDPNFLKWAIGVILAWNNQVRPKNLYHIHGTNDKIFPIKKVEPDFVIKNGGHFMVYQNAEEISTLINTLLIN